MKEISRRSFVKRSLTVLVGASCLSQGLAEALAQARKAGKPLLTAENLTKLFSDDKANKELAAEAAQSVRGFLRKRFHVTPTQDKQLENWPEGKLSELKKLLRAVAKDGGSLRVTDTDRAPNPREKESRARATKGAVINPATGDDGGSQPAQRARQIDVHVSNPVLGNLDYHDEWK